MSAAPTAATPAAPSQSQQPLQSGIVRSILSGDTLIIRPKGSTDPSAQKTIHIAGIAAPRLGTRDREDEPQAFSSRDFLRLLTVGKEIRYRVEYTVPAPSGAPREYAHVFLPPRGPGMPDTNVAHEILRAGWAKVHDSTSRRNNPSLPTSEEDEDGGWKSIQRSVMAEAQEEGKGLWGPDSLWKVSHTMPEDSVAFLNEWKGIPIDGIVESVKDGNMLRVRLLLAPRSHHVINLSLAGVKAPRVGGGSDRGPNAGGEPFGQESLFFVESRLLQRNVKVHLLSLPQTSGAPPGTMFSGTPAPPLTASYIIGSVQHPAGDIAQFLLSNGLAKVVDWHAGFINATFPGTMDKYRASERAAKEKRLGVWKDWAPPAAAAHGAQANGVNGHAAAGSRAAAGKQFEGIVTRIVSPESLSVKPVSGGPEQRVFLASVRQPAPRDANLAGYGQEAREFLRKKLVGKHVRVHIDYIKPKEAEFEEKHCATVLAIRAGGGQSSKETGSINEQLIARGLATVQRHRKDDESRSSEFDKLMTAEATAISEQKGVHSGKENPLARIPDGSENAGKANSYLPSLKRSGKTPAVVDFVAGASRIKVIVPRENVKVTVVLAGIKAPRIGRNPNEKDEPFAREGLAFATDKLLQRDVDIEVFGTDKVGGFIGAVYLNRTENFAVSLVENGLAEVHAYSAESVSFGPQLTAAEAQAKAQRKGMWHDHVDAPAPAEVAPAPVAQNGAPAPARKEYVDVIVSDVRGNGTAEQPFGFAVQILDDKISQLETLMSELAVAHRSAAPSAPIGFTPRSGDVVSAKFSADGCWYRAQIRRSHPSTKTASVVYIDYGNMEEVSWKDLRPLDISRFGKGRLAPQAHEARLSFVKLYDGKSTEYAVEAIERFREGAEGRKLIANIELREPATASNGNMPRLHLTLYDPADPNVGNPASCLNMDLVREGWALLDRSVPYAKSQPSMIAAVSEAEQEARKARAGIFIYGDPTED